MISILSVPDEGYSRYASCARLTSTFLLVYYLDNNNMIKPTIYLQTEQIRYMCLTGKESDDTTQKLQYIGKTCHVFNKRLIHIIQHKIHEYNQQGKFRLLKHLAFLPFYFLVNNVGRSFFIYSLYTDSDSSVPWNLFFGVFHIFNRAIEFVSGCCFTPIFQLYHGKNKLFFNEMMMRPALY